MQVIAEGAETAEQVEFLCLHKCDQVQGYFFSKAVKFTAIKELINHEEFANLQLQDILSRHNALS
jgi:EAL domain-containing protein (putative c-di-GMP-specific phosphodiesterase class I)